MSNTFRTFTLDVPKRHATTPGIWMRAVFGEGASVNLVELEPGVELALHEHPHEQIGVVLRGTQVLHVDGVDHELGPMDAYVIPGGVPHSGLGGGGGCLVLDIFVPAREDYRQYSVEPAGG